MSDTPTVEELRELREEAQALGAALENAAQALERINLDDLREAVGEAKELAAALQAAAEAQDDDADFD